MQGGVRMTSTSTPRLEFGAWDLPPEVDWVGFDSCAPHDSLLARQLCYA